MLAHPQARITAMGSYLPKRVLTNQDLEKMVETSDDWIVSRTGIRERRVADPDEFASTMGIQAAKKAMEKAGISAEKIDCILFATMTPDYFMPSTASLVQAGIGAFSAAAFDVQAACSGYLYGLSVAKAYIESKMYRTVLLVASEKMSSFIDYADRNTCVLFGDGAAAAVVTGEGEGLLIENVLLGSDGSLGSLLMIPGGAAREPVTEANLKNQPATIKMSGKEVFKHAVRRMSQAAENCLQACALSSAEVDWLVPHQANQRIIEATAKSIDFPREKVYQTLERYGNTSASSIGIALDELAFEKKITKNSRILLVAFGGGLTWGSAMLKKN